MADVGDQIPPMIQGRLESVGKCAKFAHVHFKGSRSFIVASRRMTPIHHPACAFTKKLAGDEPVTRSVAFLQYKKLEQR